MSIDQPKDSLNWAKIKGYLQQNISLIPVRDKDEGNKPKKTPYNNWKRFQTEIISEAELFELMTKYDTTATAFICGKVSNNLEILDLDCKHWEGIDTLLFIQIKDLLPDVWNRLRIHSTPSGGKHILYFIEDHEPEGNQKLAWKDGMREAAIETRGEKGFALSDTSAGYTVYKDNPIPTITWAERCNLFSICRSFNQRVKVEAIKPKREHNDFYDENPFEDFNKKDQGHVLTEYGWTKCGENSQFITYTRPGKKNGISASFVKDKNIYYIFTSSTELEPSRGYFPSMILSKYMFNNDNKALYEYLVQKGYGKVNRQKEMKFAETKARRKEPIPNNFSEEAKAKYDETKEKVDAQYPFGEFIKWDDEAEKNDVSREAFYFVSENLGFRLYDNNVVRIVDHTVVRVTEREFYDTLKAYIKSDDPDELEELLNIYEKFIQRNGEFSISRLRIFDENLLLKDDRQNAYLFYQNCWLHITAEKIDVHEYEDFPEGKLIFSEKLLNRDFHKIENQEEDEETDVSDSGEIIKIEKEKTGYGPYGVYYDFLDKAIGVSTYLKQVIGFLLHDYKDETTGYIPGLTERCENPEEGGGAGKNVFCNLLGLITTTVNKNCNNPKYDEKFFQLWTKQRIMILSDVVESFNFAFLKEASTGSILYKRLHQNEIEIPVHKTPKFLFQTNYSVKISDGGVKRRIRILEFTNFFTNTPGINVVYSKHFPNDWSKEDYQGFDNFSAESIQEYLKAGLKINEPEISGTGWMKRFRQTYGQTIVELIEENIVDWVKRGKIKKEEFANDLKKYYEENGTNKNFQPSIFKINKALSEYCTHHKIAFKPNHQWSELGINYRGKSFLSEFEESMEKDITIKPDEEDPF